MPLSRALSLPASLAAVLARIPVTFAQQDVVTIEEAEQYCVGDCCPPTLAQKVFIGVGTLVLAAVCFFLLVRILERHAIKRGTSALVGRHMGISLSLLLTAAGLAGLIFAITGCFPFQLILIVGVVGAIWLIHLLYALVAIR
jgi:hypothetical protein